MLIIEEVVNVARIRSSSLSHGFSENKISQASPSNGIYSLFILRESGCPFFYRIYRTCGPDPDPAILGGFFIALSLFAKEVTAGELETITTSPCRYSFYPLHQGLLVLCSVKDFNPIRLEKIMKKIAKLFVTKYNGRLLKPQPASISAPKLAEKINDIFNEVLS